jgi:hypothetical protein
LPAQSMVSVSCACVTTEISKRNPSEQTESLFMMKPPSVEFGPGGKGSTRTRSSPQKFRDVSYCWLVIVGSQQIALIPIADRTRLLVYRFRDVAIEDTASRGTMTASLDRAEPESPPIDRLRMFPAKEWRPLRSAKTLATSRTIRLIC